MTRNVKLVISGLDEKIQDTEQDRKSRAADMEHDAEYFQRNGSHYLLYEEQPQGFDAVSKCRLKIHENYMELIRQGDVRTRMVFEPGKTHPVDYQTPFGSLAMEIYTKKVEVKVEENTLYVTVDYSLETWGDSISDCRIEITVKTEEYTNNL